MLLAFSHHVVGREALAGFVGVVVTVIRPTG
jgi:hypothetical protein